MSLECLLLLMWYIYICSKNLNKHKLKPLRKKNEITVMLFFYVCTFYKIGEPNFLCKLLLHLTSNSYLHPLSCSLFLFCIIIFIILKYIHTSFSNILTSWQTCRHITFMLHSLPLSFSLALIISILGGEFQSLQVFQTNVYKTKPLSWPK